MISVGDVENLWDNFSISVRRSEVSPVRERKRRSSASSSDNVGGTAVGMLDGRETSR